MTTSAATKRLPARSGDQQDVVSSHRHVHTWTQRPGATSRVKREMRRAERRFARIQIRNGQES